MQLERALVFMKPDAVQRKITGEVLQRFERAGYKIVGAKMVRPTKEQFFAHYETIGQLQTRRGEAVYLETLRAMMLGPVIAYVLEGVNAVENIRKMVGSTQPAGAVPGTIRGDYAHMTYAYTDATKCIFANIVHASATVEEAQAEIALWFKSEELFSYESGNDVFFK
jgi:nucleoside-diphosphate kinase